MSSAREPGVPPGALSALLRDLVSVPDTGDTAWEHGFWPGRRVGRFELVRRIGRGGSGVVIVALEDVGRADDDVPYLVAQP